MTALALTPRLVCKDAARAIEFYVKALGATEIARFTQPDGHIVDAQLSIGDIPFSLTEEKREWHNASPQSLKGSPVALTLTVEDAIAVGERMVDAGAKVVFPIEDQFYGKREGRLVDPFGHVWVVSQQIEQISSAEIAKRMRG